MVLVMKQILFCVIVVAYVSSFFISPISAIFTGPKLSILNKTENGIHIQWTTVNSLSATVEKYKVSAYPIQSFGHMQLLNRNEWAFYNSTTRSELTGLHPGTLYNISVWAITSDGPTEHSTVQTWTEVGDPETPLPVEIVDRNGKTMTVNLPPGESSNGPISNFHVIILERSPIISFTPSELSNYADAEESGIPFYVTATLTPEQANQTFIIGDEKLYGGYYNAPLLEAKEYEVLVGVLSTLNGVTKAAYSPLQSSNSMSHSSNNKVQISSTLSVVLSAAIGVFGFLLVLSVIVYFVLRKHYGHRRPSDEMVLRVHGSDIEENGFAPDMTELYDLLKERYWQIPRSNLEVHQTVLGIGQFGEVREGVVHRRLQIIPCVIQQMQAPTTLLENERRNLLKELDIMARAGFHPNVVEFLGACDEREVLQVAIEHHATSLRGLLLRSRQQKNGKISNLSEPLLLEMCIGIAQGMSHLADQGVFHRHLSSRNIVITGDSVPKVAHFALGHYSPLGKKLLYTRWAAPETVNSHTYTSKCDVWSYGVLLWEIFTLGGSPFVPLSTKDVPMRVMQGMRLPKPKGVSDDLFQLMLHCWELDPDERPGFIELSSILQNMFLNARDYIHFENHPDYQYEKFDPSAEDE